MIERRAPSERFRQFCDWPKDLADVAAVEQIRGA
jgi:hypothetical protein